MRFLRLQHRPPKPQDPWRCHAHLLDAERVVALAATVPEPLPSSLPGPLPLIASITTGPEDDPARRWGPTARARLDSAVRDLVDLARRQGSQVWLWPSAAGAVSDLPTILQLARRHADDPLRIFLEPAALLAPSMVPTLDDFFARCAEAIVPLPAVAAVLLSNPSGAPVHQGPAGREAFARLLRAAADAGKPLALPDRDADAQASWLGMG